METKNTGIKDKLVKVVKGIGIVAATLLLLMYIVPLFFADTIAKSIKDLANENIKAKMEFETIDLSFYKKFPALTVTIENPEIKGVGVFEDKTLLQARSISFGIDLFSLLQDKIKLNTVFIDEVDFNVLVDAEGNANYNIWISDDEKPKKEDDATDLRIEKIKITEANIRYEDLSNKLFIEAKGFNYLGTGDLSSEVFELKTLAKMESFDLIFNEVAYVKQKPVSAKLITKVDTKSLNFVFEENDLRVKELPISFKGKFGFLDKGYDLSFDVVSKDGKLEHLLSLLPMEYQSWLEQTAIQGVSDLTFQLKGQYIAEENIKPSVELGLKVKEGSIAYNKIADPLKDFNLDFYLTLPDLDLERLKIAINTVEFTLKGQSTKGSFHSLGLESPIVSGALKSSLDLKVFQQTLGISQLDLSGHLDLDFSTEGQFARAVVVSGLRNDQIDTVVSSIPKFKLSGQLKEGYLKMADLPAAVEKINFKLYAEARDSLYQNTTVDIQGLNAQALTNYVKGHFKLKNLRNYDLDANVQLALNLAELTQFVPLSQAEMRGDVRIDLVAKGTYEPRKKRFPVMNAVVKVDRGYIKLHAMPELPIEDIDIETNISSKRGSYSDLLIKVLPIQFKIAGESFKIDADLYNLNNLRYRVKSKGSLNIGNIYKLFKIDGLNVGGSIQTDLSLRGLQSDAVAGNYSKLKNSGLLTVNSLFLKSELFPKPLDIKRGVFKFFQEKMLFEDFRAVYGSSKFSMNGHLSNVIQFITSDQGQLHGQFDLKSKSFNVDEFMVFAPSTAAPSKGKTAATAGVVMIPSHFDMRFNADVKQIKYSDLLLKNFVGSVLAQSGKVVVDQANFDLVGTQVAMKASYKPTSYTRAHFDYEIDAANFDIQRAYKEIKLFREMATMAKDAYGKVSLKYKLNGTLNGEMFPIMNTLEGEGQMTLEDIQFKGFKLLNSIASKTDMNSLEDGSVSKVEINTSIKNNVMTIERTRMKMAGFRPRFEGQITLDGQMNIGFRLGLPPLGIIGIPMRIMGTADKFNIKLGRYKEEDLEDKPDEEDVEEARQLELAKQTASEVEVSGNTEEK
ncbi:AsmA-like C-terminal region-containing protein [Flavobacterium sp. JP2137]|uniref:AsmA family protein n=1 Tax=Flavobacterium sp. JP2137 TaxID=3414510 RepID=UPI003D3001F1